MKMTDKTQDIVKCLIEEFRNLVKEYESDLVFDASEFVNKESDVVENSKGLSKIKYSKFIYFINNYHAYCKICKQHFYSYSKSDDINSFFQSHLNSPNHVRNRYNTTYDVKKPILKWEKWLYTGYCEICEMSGLEAFIVDTNLDINQIAMLHCRGLKHRRECMYNKHLLQRILPRVSLLEKICIVMLSGELVCKLCRVKISKELFENHMKSELHYKFLRDLIFCSFDINIDKFNKIEDATKLFHKFLNEGIVINCRNTDILNRDVDVESDIESDPENQKEQWEGFGSERVSGFSPKNVQLMLSINDSDFCEGLFCTLCCEENVNMARHFMSNSHKMRLIVFERCNAVQPDFNVHYNKKRSERLNKFSDAIRKYEKLKNFLGKQGLNFGIDFRPEFTKLVLPHQDEGGGVKSVNKEKLNEKATEDILVKPDFQAHLSQERKLLENIDDVQTDTEMTDSSSDFDIQKNSDSKNENNVSHRIQDPVKNTKTNIEYPINNINIVSVEKTNIMNLLTRHITRQDSIVKENNENPEFCMYCNRVVGPDEMSEHKVSESHQRSVTQTRLFLQEMKKESFLDLIQNIKYYSDSFFVCVACGVMMTNSDSIFSHIKSPRHMNEWFIVKQKDNRGIPYKRISFLDYHFDTNVISCKKCGEVLFRCWKLKRKPSFSLVLKKIRQHSYKTCHARAVKYFPQHATKNVDIKPDIYRTGDSNSSVSDNNVPILPHSGAPKQLPAPTSTSEKNSNDKSGSDGYEGLNVDTKDKKNSERTVKQEDRKQMRNKSKAFKHKLPRLPSRKNIIGIPKESVLKGVLKPYIKKQQTKMENFLCHICLVSDSLDFLEGHINSENHMKNEGLAICNRAVIINECRTCKILLLGCDYMFGQHFGSRYHAENEQLNPATHSVVKSAKNNNGPVLLVKGLPKINFEEKKELLYHLFERFGAIRYIKVNKLGGKISFMNPEIVKTILEMEISVGKFKLTLGIKEKDEGLMMENETIFMLGHLEHLEEFTYQLEKKANEMELDPTEKFKEKALCESLTECISAIYPNCKCYPFGSRITGLTIGTSDLDVFVDFGNSCEDTPSTSEDMTAVLIAKALKNSKSFRNVVCIAKCRVPVINCEHIYTQIRCDVTFKNSLGCANSSLIKYMISLDLRIKRLVLFIKYWTKSIRLHGRPFFSSYALVMLVFFYLQQEPNPILPTVEYLKDCYRGPEKYISGWNCGFSTDPKDIKATNNHSSVPELILGFFKFCSSFNFCENVISPLTGKPLNREDMLHIIKNSSEKAPDMQHPEIVLSNFISDKNLISIMDPFDLNHNLTKSFPKFRFHSFIYFCRISAELLSNALQCKSFLHLY